MPSWLVALFLKPFVAVCYGLVVWFACWLVWRYVPEGKVKRALLAPIRIPKKERIQPYLRQIRLRRRP